MRRRFHANATIPPDEYGCNTRHCSTGTAIFLHDFVVPLASSRSALACPRALQISRSTSKGVVGCAAHLRVPSGLAAVLGSAV